MFKKLLFGLFIAVNAFSAANVTTIPGATAIQFYFRNYTYANLSLDLPILSMGLATDLNKLVYRNSIGNMYKIMVDASGSSNTPQNRIFYADVNGSATSSTNLTFDGTTLYINSGTGSSITTGRVTATNVVASDTVSGNTVIGNTIKGGTLEGTTLNTGNGANELYPMNQGVRTTDGVIFDTIKATKNINAQNFLAYNNTGAGTYIGLFKGIGNLPGYPSSYFPVLKTDYDYLYMSTGNKQCGIIGKEYFEIIDTSNASLSKFVVYKDTTKVKVLKTDSIKIGPGSYLKTYLDTTFYDSLYDGSTYTSQRALAKIVQIGNVVTLYQPTITASVSGSLVTIRGIPTKFRPTNTVDVSMVVTNNSNTLVGYGNVATNGYIYLLKTDGNFLDAGTGGSRRTCISWLLN